LFTKIGFVDNYKKCLFSSTRKRKTTEHEELNTKTFKMSDLIGWRPKEENQLRKKWNEKKSELKERENNEAARPSTSQAKVPIAAPRVKLDEKGEIVIDAESLVITERPEDNAWTTVHEVSHLEQLNPNLRILGFHAQKVELYEFQEEFKCTFSGVVK
jgi:hypothetical protein